MRWAGIALLLCVRIAAGSQAAAEDNTGVKQPIEFNHKLHVTELKQACQMCHANPDPGEMVDMPDTAKCLSCHSGITPRTPGERKLVAFGKQNRDVEWVRVYQIPTFVRFDHRQHAGANVKCVSCHGRVELQTVMSQARDVSMGSCVSCHQQMHASLDCGSCHSPR